VVFDATRTYEWDGPDTFLADFRGDLLDAYGASEQRVGLLTMLQEHLAVPFTTEILEVPVRVTRIDLNDADEIVAVSRRGQQRQMIPILNLPLPSPPPDGWEWIEAYRHWARGGR
jgi:hypothetical protein